MQRAFVVLFNILFIGCDGLVENAAPGGQSVSPGSWAHLRVGIEVDELPGDCSSGVRSKRGKPKGKMTWQAVQRRDRMRAKGIDYNPCNPGVTEMTCDGMPPFTRSTKLYIKDGVVQMIELYGPALGDEAEAQSACGLVLEQLKSAYGEPTESTGHSRDFKWIKDGNTSYYTSRFPWSGCKLTLQNSGFRYRTC